MYKQQKLMKIVFFLSLVGILLSGYLTNLHYSKLSSPCDFNETFQCSIVNRSSYAEFFGVPVALFGLLGYVFMGAVSLSLFRKDRWERFPEKLMGNFMFNKIVSDRTLAVFSFAALGVSLYLTYAEFFLIKAICILCIISQVIIIAIAIISYRNLSLKKSKEGEQEFH